MPGWLLLAAFSLLHSTKAVPFAAERSIVQSVPVRMSVHLPEGWTITDGQVVPAATLRGSCQVQASLYSDSDWKTAIESLVHDTEPNSRVLSKMAGHVAVEYLSHSGSTSKRVIYIDLEDIRPRTFAVWNLQNDNTDAGQQCRMALAQMIATTEFEAVLSSDSSSR